MFIFTESTKKFSEGINELYRSFPSAPLSHDVTLAFEASTDRTLSVSYNKSTLTITGTLPIHFFRGFATFLQKISNIDLAFELTEEIHFDELGAMLDCSRNAVLTVEMVKHYLRFLAASGMNLLLLYTEDTYEVKDYPYFGYYRGRYTQEELKQIDDYAFSLGIEVVPCIQTLAHLHCVLRWAAMNDLVDTPDSIYVGSPKVISFIESIIKAATAPFRSNRIHLGMDEAHYLGLGRYLFENGYTSRRELMETHLKSVQKICDSLSLESMLWSDMFFRVLSPTNSYDIPEDIDLTDYKLPSDKLHLVYWDYYHYDTNLYEKFLKLHMQMDSGCCFAGGGWIWNGLAPNFKKAFLTTDAGMSACKRINLRKAFCTMWQDNGAETPHSAGFPSMLYFAEQGYHSEIDMDAFSDKLEYLTSINFDSYSLMARLDNHPSLENENLTSNPSKYCLYQDPLVGLFDEQIKSFELGKYYSELAQEFDELDDDSLLTEYYRELAHTLALKADLGNRIYDAYKSGNKSTLDEIAKVIIPKCFSSFETLRSLREELWFYENKAFGWEVIDLRIGGIETRLRSAMRRILSYTAGEIDKIEELEVERLKYVPSDKEALISCNFWEHIVSANVIAGV